MGGRAPLRPVAAVGEAWQMSATVDGPPADAPARLSRTERAARGKAARGEVPRSAHGDWAPAADRPDPLGVLAEQAVDRLQDLVPIRHGRMLISPFAFYRGGAAIMAADLAPTPVSGLSVQLCGDAHLSNFGAFASPERDLVFDLNDFDETLPGPWEWDVKRLAASVEIAARENGFKPAQRRRSVLSTVRAYRDAMRSFAAMRNLEVWYARVDAAAILAEAATEVDRQARRRFERRASKARSKDSLRAVARLTTVVDGESRIVADPPIVVPIADLLPGAPGEELRERILELLRTYKASLRSDRRHLLDGYRFVDLARKVVGVGSVGTRAWIVLLLGADGEDPLVLQVKEATASVLEPHAGAARQRNHGKRVVAGQWLTQSASDILLGWLRATGIDDVQRDFYVRQLWDWKLSAEVETMGPGVLPVYGHLCGATLARAHARSGDRVAIAAYLGSGDAFDRALADFAEAYADQNERDHAALAKAVEAGTVAALTGL
jgi:uncharacterized protein (DUF2252 family)